MSRIFRMLGLAMVLIALLVVTITGTVFAAGGNPDKGNQGEECPYGDCDCIPNSYNWDYNSPGPHGAPNGVED